MLFVLAPEVKQVDVNTSQKEYVYHWNQNNGQNDAYNPKRFV